MRQVADGSAEALGLLHRRFARLIFGMAVQSLDRAAAEDLVQEVFLAVWRNARRFDPERGTVRAWVLQITHFRLLNELRRRSRQPEVVPDPDGLVLADLPARDPGPAEATWDRHRRAVLKAAGNTVHVVESNRTNIKLTTRADLILAEAILKAQPKPKPSGPIHPFAEEEMWGGRPKK